MDRFALHLLLAMLLLIQPVANATSVCRTGGDSRAAACACCGISECGADAAACSCAGQEVPNLPPSNVRFEWPQVLLGVVPQRDGMSARALEVRRLATGDSTRGGGRAVSPRAVLCIWLT